MAQPQALPVGADPMGGAGGNADGMGPAPAGDPPNGGMQEPMGAGGGMPPNDPGEPLPDMGGGYGGDGSAADHLPRMAFMQADETSVACRLRQVLKWAPLLLVHQSQSSFHELSGLLCPDEACIYQDDWPW